MSNHPVDILLKATAELVECNHNQQREIRMLRELLSQEHEILFNETIRESRVRTNAWIREQS